MKKLGLGLVLALSLIGCADSNAADTQRENHPLAGKKLVKLADANAKVQVSSDDGCVETEDGAFECDDVEVETTGSTCEIYEDGSWKCWGDAGEPQGPSECGEPASDEDVVATDEAEGVLAEDSEDESSAEAVGQVSGEDEDDTEGCTQTADGAWECEDEATPDEQSTCEVFEDGSWVCEGSGYREDCGDEA